MMTFSESAMFVLMAPDERAPRWAFKEFVKMGLNYEFSHNFLTYHGASGVNGIGRMACAPHWKEISLYKPGFISRVPAGAADLLDRIAKVRQLQAKRSSY